MMTGTILCSLRDLGISSANAITYYDESAFNSLCKLVKGEKLVPQDAAKAISLGQELGLICLKGDGNETTVVVWPQGVGLGSKELWKVVISNKEALKLVESNLNKTIQVWIYTLLSEKIPLGDWKLEESI